MIYALILAGGKGTRMGNTDKPKQFMMIGEKPIIVHTVEKFFMNDRFKKIIVLCPEQWIPHTKELLHRFLPTNEKAVVIPGGAIRNETILNGIHYIEETDGLTAETCLVTHDAVRPFVTHRIIEDNIESVLKGNACDTVVPATDTLVESKDGVIISDIPDRANYYMGQTPQSFRAQRFLDLYNSLTDEEKSILTDAAKVFVIKGDSVDLVSGESFNIKVTYPYDLQLAETLLKGTEI